MNHFLFMVLHKKVNLFMPHHFIKCRLLVTLHLNAFEPLYILYSSHLNHNCKVLIAFHLGLHIEKDGPHTPCSHANKLKNVSRGQLDKCRFRNLKCVSQNNLDLSQSRFTCLLALAIAFSHCDKIGPEGCSKLAHSWPHDFDASGLLPKQMGVRACPTP